MKKFIHILLAAIAFAGAIQTPAKAAQVQYFYYWTDDNVGTSSYAGFTNPGHTQFTCQAAWCSVDHERKVRVEAWRYDEFNVFHSIYDQTFYDVLQASYSIALGTATNSFASVRITIDNGAYAVIYGQANH